MIACEQQESASKVFADSQFFLPREGVFQENILDTP